ncbi:MAG: DUF4347 domain-containing protein [Deltaproteobacteria bacterium]|nr:MAG: DUF4347 domain-containing protein [Deltaproteobacteria bacterium]
MKIKENGMNRRQHFSIGILEGIVLFFLLFLHSSAYAGREPIILPSSEAPVPVAPQSAQAEILFIDPAVKDYLTLLSGLREGVKAVVLDPTRDGVGQISDVLSHRQERPIGRTDRQRQATLRL